MKQQIIYLGFLALALPVLGQEVNEAVKQRSERAVLNENIAVEQARARAQTRSDYGLELRPRVTNEDVAMALRIYLPEHWNKSKLRDQLEQVAASERLRVTALEWTELMEVYRLFCEYRAIQKRIELYEIEVAVLEPYLELAREGVELNQLSVAERAKLTSIYLDLVNNHEDERLDQLVIEREIRLLVGLEADLEAMAKATVVRMPSKVAFSEMIGKAMANRSDYKQFEMAAQALHTAEDIAVQEDGFRLKYVQPLYSYDYKDDNHTYGVAASFILPWGTKNPDIQVFQEQRKLLYSEQALKRMILEHRLNVLLASAEDYYALATERSDRIKPLLNLLVEDLVTLDTGRLEDLRDLLLVRERVLDIQLGTTRAIEERERIAVELAAELGSLTP